MLLVTYIKDLLLKRYFILFLLCLIFAACSKQNDDHKDQNTSGITFPNSISKVSLNEVMVSGVISAFSGYYESGVTVSVNNNKVYSDQNGRFSFVGRISNTDKLIMKFSKTGFNDFYKTLVVENGAVYSGIKVLLHAHKKEGNVPSETGGLINIGNPNLIFPDNAVTTTDDRPYKGQINIDQPGVSMYSIPGDMRGRAANGTSVVLETYGAFKLLLSGDAGEALKLSKSITYKYLYGYGQSSKPESLNLFRFDEAEGIWVDEGKAILTGDFYVGTTTKTGWFQLAKSHPGALLRLTIKDKNSIPAYKYSLISSFNEYNYAHSYSTIINNKGVALVYLPADVGLSTILRTPCDEPVMTDLKGGYKLAPNTKTEKAVVADLDNNLVNIGGKISSCNSKLVSGSAEFVIGGEIYTTKNN